MEQATTKYCRDCGHAKPCEEFHRRAGSPDGRNSRCRGCVKVHKRAYYEANRERLLVIQRERRASGEWGILRRPHRMVPATVDKKCVKCSTTKPWTNFNRCAANADGLQPVCRDCEKVQKRAYYETNRERLLAETRRQNALNPEKNRRKAREWQRLNRDRASTRQRAWRDVNADLVRQWGQSFARRHPDRVRTNTAKQRARRRGAATIPFTAAQLAQRMSMFAGCWMCGGPREAIDHVKPLNKGGTHCLSNLRISCSHCNTSKGDRWPYPTRLLHKVS